MSGKSAIEWTNMTWNPLVGCTRVTQGCDHCYAFTLHEQRHAVYQKNDGFWHPDGMRMPRQYAQPFSTLQLLPERLEQPLHIKKSCMIFTNSMSDLFHSQVPDDYIFQIFDVMRRAHWHTFQILTKRIGRLKRLAPQIDWPFNVWIGTSIENDRVTPRANILRTLPAAVRFLSCEPLLGPVPSLDLEGLDWIIVGGESGADARPMEEIWALDIRDRCVELGIPFFFKQFGGRTPKAGGRMLQGRTWDEYPKPMNRSLKRELALAH
jgi:protein gp37